MAKALSMRACVWVLAGLLAVRLALMALTPVFEPSEARYAAISANMARSGDFVVPRFTHSLEYQVFAGKPPLVFQAGGLFCRLFGMDAPAKLQFAVRLFPLLSALLLLAILHHAVRRKSDAETARLAVVICATTTAFFASAGIAMTDMPLSCCVTGALLLYWLFLDGFQFRYALAVGALLGAGMIVKGPVALVMFGLPVLADAIVNRRWKGIFNARWLAALPVFLLVAVPWFVLIERRCPGSVVYFFYNENFLRFVSHDYGDKYGAGREAFRGAAILWALVATLPWSLVPVGRGLAEIVRNVRSAHRANPTGRTVLSETVRQTRDEIGRLPWNLFPFLAAVAITAFWCLTSRVLIYYLFPIIALAAAALALSAPRDGLNRLVRPAAALTLLVCAGTFVGGTFLSPKMRGAATEFEVGVDHYAYEFYHGRKSEAFLSEWRWRMKEYLAEQEAMRRAKGQTK